MQSATVLYKRSKLRPIRCTLFPSSSCSSTSIVKSSTFFHGGSWTNSSSPLSSLLSSSGNAAAAAATSTNMTSITITSCCSFTSTTTQNNHTNTSTATATTTNYFQLLQQPQSFSISLPLLKESYQSQMKILHPDKHTLQSIEKQQEVADLSSKVIRGYEILKDDYQRALHLLELHGEALELEGTTASMQILQENDDGDEKKNAVDTDVLFQVMEIREQIDAVDLKGGDDADGKKRRELNRLLQENQGRIEETVEFLKEAFGRNDWVHAKRLVATLQYWNRIKETILEKL